MTRLHGWQVALFWLVAGAILLAPLVVSGVAELTMQEMLGKGLLW